MRITKRRYRPAHPIDPWAAAEYERDRRERLRRLDQELRLQRTVNEYDWELGRFTS